MNVGTGAGQIGVSGNTVSFGGVAIGSFTASRSLTVNFNSAATQTAVQALLRRITFSTISDTPSTLDRTVRFTLTDGDGGTSNAPTKVVKVTAVMMHRYSPGSVISSATQRTKSQRSSLRPPRLEMPIHLTLTL